MSSMKRTARSCTQNQTGEMFSAAGLSRLIINHARNAEIPKLTVGGYRPPMKKYCRSRKVSLRGFFKRRKEKFCSKAEHTTATPSRISEPYLYWSIQPWTSRCMESDGIRPSERNSRMFHGVRRGCWHTFGSAAGKYGRKADTAQCEHGRLRHGIHVKGLHSAGRS